jgi:hypothetical protein
MLGVSRVEAGENLLASRPKKRKAKPIEEEWGGIVRE